MTNDIMLISKVIVTHLKKKILALAVVLLVGIFFFHRIKNKTIIVFRGPGLYMIKFGNSVINCCIISTKP